MWAPQSALTPTGHMPMLQWLGQLAALHVVQFHCDYLVHTGSVGGGAGGQRGTGRGGSKGAYRARRRSFSP